VNTDGGRTGVYGVIMGCGRVGSTLAHILEARGNTVAVSDQNPDAFRRLSAGFEGTTVTGVGFDRESLLEAGIDRADAFAAVSSGDNSNIISARLAREVFGVETVVARIYDPGRAAVYQRLGIPTVATVRWTADQMLRRLLPEGSETEWVDPSGSMQLAEVHPAKAWFGHPVTELEQATGARVAFLTRDGDGLLPEPDTVIQEGDLVHVVMRTEEAEKVVHAFENPPEVEV